MKQTKILASTLLFVLTTASTMLFEHSMHDTLARRDLLYRVGGRTMASYLVYDSTLKGERPAVLIAPEWWGQDACERLTADRLAQQGYAVLIVDLYGNGFATANAGEASQHLDEAQKDSTTLSQRFIAAYDQLIMQPEVKPDSIAAVGFGLGGGVVIDEARRGLGLKAVVDYYGGLNSVTHAASTETQTHPEILVLVGKNDAYVDQTQIDSFVTEMKGANVNVNVQIFTQAYHDFARIDADKLGEKNHLPLSYDREAAEKSWQAVKQLLERNLHSS